MHPPVPRLSDPTQGFFQTLMDVNFCQSLSPHLLPDEPRRLEAYFPAVSEGGCQGLYQVTRKREASFAQRGIAKWIEERKIIEKLLKLKIVNKIRDNGNWACSRLRRQFSSALTYALVRPLLFPRGQRAGLRTRLSWPGSDSGTKTGSDDPDSTIYK